MKKCAKYPASFGKCKWLDFRGPRTSVYCREKSLSTTTTCNTLICYPPLYIGGNTRTANSEARFRLQYKGFEKLLKPIILACLLALERSCFCTSMSKCAVRCVGIPRNNTLTRTHRRGRRPPLRARIHHKLPESPGLGLADRKTLRSLFSIGSIL